MCCSLGQSWTSSTVDCNGSSTSYTWQEALVSAQSSDFADQEDWRISNIKELATIVEEACYSPSINENIFPGAGLSEYWSATYSAAEMQYGHFPWYINFYHGQANDNGGVTLMKISFTLFTNQNLAEFACINY